MLRMGEFLCSKRSEHPHKWASLTEMPFPLAKYEMYEFGDSTCIAHCPTCLFANQPKGQQETKKNCSNPVIVGELSSPTHVSGFDTFVIVHHVYIYLVYTMHTGHQNILQCYMCYDKSKDILIYYNGYKCTTLQWIYNDMYIYIYNIVK